MKSRLDSPSFWIWKFPFKSCVTRAFWILVFVSFRQPFALLLCEHAATCLNPSLFGLFSEPSSAFAVGRFPSSPVSKRNTGVTTTLWGSHLLFFNKVFILKPVVALLLSLKSTLRTAWALLREQTHFKIADSSSYICFIYPKTKINRSLKEQVVMPSAPRNICDQPWM